MDLSAILGERQTISGATLGAQPTIKSGMHTDGPNFGFRIPARTHFPPENPDQGMVPLEDVIQQMKGNTLNNILRVTDQRQNGNALADE